MYEFKTRPPVSKRPAYIIADHGDDILFALGMFLMDEFEGKPVEFPTNDDTEKVQSITMQYWANFAKTGYEWVVYFIIL